MNKKKIQHNSRFYGLAKEKVSQGGFTLIEIMVSVAIFAIIMTTGIGALVSLTNSYKISQKNKQVNDSLNYTLETMTRELRLGRDYRANASSANQSPNDGEGSSIGFIATDNRGYIIFNLDNGILYRERYSGTLGDSIDALTNPDEVAITDINFTVIGTGDITNDGNYQQPLVWIQIQAIPAGAENDTTPSAVQTLVSQRILDA